MLGFVVQAASEDSVWLNVLQYAIPLGALWWALHSIFRQRVSRFIDMTRRPDRAAPAGGAA